MASERSQITLPVRPWFADHHFAGRIVLAAVEAMQFLALTAQAAHPHLEVGKMRDARFARLLEIPLDAAEIEVLVELEREEKGEVSARLLTRVEGKVIARLVTHCELTFAADAAPDSEEERWMAEPWLEPAMTVSTERVYQELVPFGPAYRTLQDRLVLDENGVWGTMLTSEPGHATEPIGSLFPLDGAMHALCVHGQRLVDFVPFPVGFAARHIVKPTRAGEQYRVQGLLQERTEDELRYDLCIFDGQEHVREWVRGLRMRDVSHGRIKPPAWIKANPTGEQTSRPRKTI